MGLEDRRLAAIAVADVVGYSRMMSEDEDGTLAALRAHFNALDPVVRNHGGRVVKTTGDGIIAEFPAATAAVQACLDVQALMRSRNETLPESRRMRLRIGVNLGDVTHDESGDVFGDGVNVAARIEPLCRPGGIALSDAVARAIGGKIDAPLTDTGEHVLKNIPRPVQVWQVSDGAAGSVLAPVLASRDRIVATVAVLPFDNMSADPDQDYFADGITEDLISALSYDKYLAVVARNSTFAYKGKSLDVRRIAAELDATHVIEGSVRKSGTRVRVTTQLIDAETGNHMWSERLDRELVDIFDLQDDLVASIASKLTPSLWRAEGRSRTPMASLDAWDLTLRGEFETNKFTEEGLLRGLELLKQARAAAPNFSTPAASAAMAWTTLYFLGWRGDRSVHPLQEGVAAADEAYRIDPDDYRAVTAKAWTSCLVGNPELGETLARRLTEMNPFGAIGYHWLGLALCSLGRLDEAIAAQTEAWRLGQHEPWRFDNANDLGYSHYLSGNYEAAIEWGREALRLLDWMQSHLLMAAAYAQTGQQGAAEPHVEAVLGVRPGFSLASLRDRVVYVRDEDRDHLIDGLRMAGLPD